MSNKRYHRNRSQSVFCAGITFLIACENPANNPNPPDMSMNQNQTIRLNGSVQKGPFVIGSTVNVSPTDDKGNPSGMVFNTKTTSDLGIFNVDVTASGMVSLEGNGFYYNEVTGDLSIAPITLRAFYSLTSAGDQAAYINMVTHLTYDRIKNLAKSGMTLVKATEQAESELRLELGLGSATFNPGKPGTELNLLGGDNDANAYLFGVSALVAQAALTRAGSANGIDAKLQEILNSTSLDLSDDGKLSPLLKTEFKDAQGVLDIDEITRLFQSRLTALGSTVVVPDLNRVVDTDGDGIPNRQDNCPLVANPTQTPITNAICGVSNAVYASTATTPMSFGGTFTAGGAPVVLTLDRSSDYTSYLSFSADSTGRLGTPVKTTLALPAPVPASKTLSCQLARVNNDAALDLVCHLNDFPSWFGVFLSNGTGGFLAGKAITVSASGYLSDYGVADFNKDGRMDLVGVDGNSLSLLTQQADGTFATPSNMGTFYTYVNTVSYAGDVNKDGNPDYLRVTYESAGARTDMAQALGDGTGKFTISTPLNFPGQYRSAAIADFNGDGFMDVAVTLLGPAGSTQDRLEVVLGGATGLSSTRTTVGMVDPAYIFGGDFTGDGKPDMLLKNLDSTKADFLILGTWNGSSVVLGPKITLHQNLSVDSLADLNKDGRLDLIGSVQLPKRGGGQTNAVATRLIF